MAAREAGSCAWRGSPTTGDYANWVKFCPAGHGILRRSLNGQEYGKQSYVPVGTMAAMDPAATELAARADTHAAGHVGGRCLFP